MRILLRFMFLVLLCLIWVVDVEAVASPKKIRALYNSLDLHSVAQHLAFYELYPNSPEAKQALRHAWVLLTGEADESFSSPLNPEVLSSAIQAVVELVNRQPDKPLPLLNEADLQTIERIAQSLPNRKLKGQKATREEEVLLLPAAEVDVARGLFLTQFGNDLTRIRSYEALIDLMALQIRAKLPVGASPEEKIRTMNHFIFYEMGFRFPPHSEYAKEIDTYTFLPSVLDSRRGVCLGVSILYICLAQRLDLNLEMITPPGHIYVRYRNGPQEINIETTARGVHIDSEEYLTLWIKQLKERTLKEIIGLAYFNQAAVYWTQEKYADALQAYKRAEPYLADDLLLKELMGYNFLFVGRQDEGVALLQEAREKSLGDDTVQEMIINDYMKGKVDVEGIRTIFMAVDEDRESILKKKARLEMVVKQHPEFRAGLFSLATTWLQLHRHGEALHALERYHELEKNDPVVEYYMTLLYAERWNYKAAWEHLHQVERIGKEKGYEAKQIKELRRELSLKAPE